MNRRNLFGAAIGAAIAGPMAAKDAGAHYGKMPIGIAPQNTPYPEAVPDLTHRVTPDMWSLREEIESERLRTSTFHPVWEPENYRCLRSVKRSVKVAWARRDMQMQEQSIEAKVSRLAEMCETFDIQCPFPVKQARKFWGW